jgi:N-acylneuraminate cytidylyltransferase
VADVKVAIIPARGGSKRIPRKNIKSFCGRPIIGYSIQAALDSGLFDHIIVSTDDEEIAEVSRAQGAETPFLRPKELADDYTGTIAVVRHALQWFREQGEEVAFACCIYATAPFIHPRYLKKGYQILQTSRKSFAFSVTSFPFPIQRAVRILADGSLDAMYSENVNVRSQDLEEAFHDAGQFYWGTSQAFLSDKVLFSPVSMPVLLPRHLVQDIDTLEDWNRAELMYKTMQMGNA